MHHSTLRPEARPLAWNELHESQQDAFRRIIRAMKDAVEELPHRESRDLSSDRSGRPDIEANRSSRLVLLSGERGTGKSSLLLTLERETSSSAAGKNKENEPKRDQDTGVGVTDLREKLIWLETLDMDPLPRPTNLLAAILARISQAVGAEAGDGSTGKLNPLSASEEALLELQRLQTDASLAWEGNIEQRAAQLDPDAYAQEVLRAEHARLSLNPRLGRVLDKLVNSMRGRCVREPQLFVLPVDDIDTNPARCVELLRLLRALSVPRLFVIVLGNIDIAHMVFEMSVAGSLAELGRNRLAKDVFNEAELPGFLREMASDALRKLIPPAQRIHLRHLSRRDALAFHPPEDSATLLDVLGKCRFVLEPLKTQGRLAYPIVTTDDKKTGSQGASISTLKDLLQPWGIQWRTPHDTDVSSTEAGKSEMVLIQGGASELLVGPARRVLDIWLAVNRLVRPSQESSDELAELRQVGNEIARTAAAWFHQAVGVDANLTPQDDLRFRQAVTVEPDGEVLIDQPMFYAKCQHRWFDRVALPLLSEGDQPSLMLNRHRQWDLMLREKLGAQDTSNAKGLYQDSTQGVLSVHSRACLEFLGDFLRLVAPQNLRGNHPVPRPNQGRYVTVNWRLPNGLRCDVPWLGPTFDTFLELNRFVDGWDRAVGIYEEFRPSVDYTSPVTDALGLNWIATAMSSLLSQTEAWSATHWLTEKSRTPSTLEAQGKAEDASKAAKKAAEARHAARTAENKELEASEEVKSAKQNALEAEVKAKAAKAEAEKAKANLRRVEQAAQEAQNNLSLTREVLDVPNAAGVAASPPEAADWKTVLAQLAKQLTPGRLEGRAARIEAASKVKASKEADDVVHLATKHVAEAQKRAADAAAEAVAAKNAAVEWIEFARLRAAAAVEAAKQLERETDSMGEDSVGEERKGVRIQNPTSVTRGESAGAQPTMPSEATTISAMMAAAELNSPTVISQMAKSLTATAEMAAAMIEAALHPAEEGEDQNALTAAAERWTQVAASVEDLDPRKCALAEIARALLYGDKGIFTKALNLSPVVSWRPRGWLLNLVVLLAPESGIPEHIAAAVLRDEDDLLYKFCQKAENQQIIRRLRGWLTKSAWEKKGSDFQPIESLLNPRAFRRRVTEAVRRCGRDGQYSKGWNGLLELLFETNEDTTVSALLKRLDSLVRNGPVLSEETLEELRLACRFQPHWRYAHDHPISCLFGGALCPTRSDVPEDAITEGLWTVEIE